MTRDARGRFCTVPDLILDAACREALQLIRWYVTQTRYLQSIPPWYTTSTTIPQPPERNLRAEAEEVLAHATHTAALLGRAS